MKLSVFFIIFFSTILLAQEAELNDLLAEYEDSQALYLKTKKESAGNLIVFSRSDLDKMQAYTLDDVLKTLRIFTAQVDNLGLTSLVKSGANVGRNMPIKLYINSHQLDSVLLGNPLTQYGKINLYFIDHIEIYQAGSSVTFGNESSGMVIKLYTKDPSRENGVFSQLSVDSRGTSSIEALAAQAIDKDYSYILNANISENQHKKYKVDRSELSRDNTRGQVYFKFSKRDSYDIESGLLQENFDTFSGVGTAPADSNFVGKHAYISLTKYFENQIEVVLSASKETTDINMHDLVGIALNDGNITQHLELDFKADVYHAKIQKQFTYNQNNIFLATEFKQTKASVDNIKSDGLNKQMQQGPTKLDMYMFSFEESYTIDENYIITADVKFDYYKDNFSKNSLLHLYRLGYTSINKSFDFKLYANTKELYPNFVQTTFSPYYKPNSNLNPYKLNILSTEAVYKTDNTKYNFGYIWLKMKDVAIFDRNSYMYVNNKESVKSQMVYIGVNHKFNLDNKIKLEYFKTYQKINLSPNSGGLIQLFNKIGEFDIYNELVYRSSYTNSTNKKMDAGYDYTLALSYPVSKKMLIKLKGENLLDKASETSINGINVPVLERRALLTMEYTF